MDKLLNNRDEARKLPTAVLTEEQGRRENHEKEERPDFIHRARLWRPQPWGMPCGDTQCGKIT
jgi:hypothetical protein